VRTFQYRESLAASSAITELKAIDLQLQTHSKITVALYTTSTNVQIKLKYVFGTDQPKSMAVSGGGIQTVTDATDADPVVFESSSHGYVVGDIVKVQGSTVQDYNVEGTISALSDSNHFTLGQVSTSGASSFSGTATATYRGTETDIQTINLTSGTLTIVNFDMKLGFLRITRNQVTGAPGGGALYIDATAAK